MEQLVSSALARQVLENYQTPPADIHAVWPQRHQVSARMWVFVDYLADLFKIVHPRGGAGCGRVGSTRQSQTSKGRLLAHPPVCRDDGQLDKLRA